MHRARSADLQFRCYMDIVKIELIGGPADGLMYPVFQGDLSRIGTIQVADIGTNPISLLDFVRGNFVTNVYLLDQGTTKARWDRTVRYQEV